MTSDTTRTRRRLRFSVPLVAVVALVALVAGVVGGRASAGPTRGGGGGGGAGALAGKRVDVIVKATNSQFWQTTFAGARRAGADTGVRVDLFGPTAETDVDGQVQLVENAISRGVDAVVLAANSTQGLDDVVDRARQAGIEVINIDSRVGTRVDGFVGTDNTKAGQQAAQRLCDLTRAGGAGTGQVLVESAVAGVESLAARENGFRAGLAAACPGLTIGPTRYSNNDVNTAAGQVNDAITAGNLVGVFAANNTSGDGAARAVKDSGGADRIPVVAFDTDPQEIGALGDGTIDALVVQNPFFFGYQGVVAAASAAGGATQPDALDPGAVLVDKANMADPVVARLLDPPTARATR